jgi:hypothetical protein
VTVRHAVVASSAAVLLAVAGCGLGPQSAPVPVAPPSGEPASARSGQDRTVSIVFLVRDGRLTPVARTARPGLQGALDLLSAGPGPRDEAMGLRSYLVGQLLEGSFDPEQPDLAVVRITEAFTLLPADEQLLAAAQLVWTATHAPGIDRVRVQADGRPVQLPTASGPQDRPVDRADYAPLAPR